jgi:hypothetical protein
MVIDWEAAEGEGDNQMKSEIMFYSIFNAEGSNEDGY